MSQAARRFRIRGAVQGVGFRYFVLKVASRLGLAGWARNERDGSVEILAQGSTEALDELAGLIEEGPPASRVESTEASDVPVDPSLAGFGVRH